MKCKALFFALVFPAFLCAQNLVPNWSFEEYEECPDGMAQIEKATGWMSFRMSPDYYNACDLSEVSGVPHNAFTSSKDALHGDAYAGFGQLTLPSEFREFLAIQLSQSLEVGQEYFVSFYVSRGIPPNSDCWANKLGARFSVHEFIGWPLEDAMPILNSSHVSSEILIADTIGWSKIEGSFLADSAYTYLVIGNHFESDEVQISCNSEGDYQAAYYFIDCICVSEELNDCPECDTSTQVGHSHEYEIISKVFPNPFSQEFRISFNGAGSGKKYLNLFGIDGKWLESTICYDNECLFSELGYLQTGLYILVVEFENGIKDQFRIIKN